MVGIPAVHHSFVLVLRNVADKAVRNVSVIGFSEGRCIYFLQVNGSAHFAAFLLLHDHAGGPERWGAHGHLLYHAKGHIILEQLLCRLFVVERYLSRCVHSLWDSPLPKLNFHPTSGQCGDSLMLACVHRTRFVPFDHPGLEFLPVLLRRFKRDFLGERRDACLFEAIAL